MRRLVVAVAIALLSPVAAFAEEHEAEHEEHHSGIEQELALDLGVEHAHETEETLGLCWRLALTPHHHVGLSGALAGTREGVASEDLAVGYDFVWAFGRIEPHAGVELGGLREREEKAAFLRTAVGVNFELTHHIFAGVVGDHAWRTDHAQSNRAMLELGFHLF